jgi:hypothetical protein
MHGGVLFILIGQEKRKKKYIYLYFVFEKKYFFIFDSQESKATKNNHANLKNCQ